MVLGIRPEHIDLNEDGFAADVELAEQTASEVYLHLRRDGLRFMARLSSDAAYSVDTGIYFDLNRAHLFDKASVDMIG